MTLIDAFNALDISRAADMRNVLYSQPCVTYNISPEMKAELCKLIDAQIIKAGKGESKITINNNKTKENTMKNVLFLAPGYPYAKTVVANLSKELDRKKIPYNASIAPKDMYIRTDKVDVEIVYMDPVKWTHNLFDNRNAVFGKKELVNKALNDFHTLRIPVAFKSLSKYILDMHADSTSTEPVKPREIYIPEITNAYFNDPVTVVLWADGTKTMVKCQDGDEYSKETGLALCIAKKALGNMPNFNNVFRKWIPEDPKPIDIPVDIKAPFANLATNIMNKFKETLNHIAEDKADGMS